MATQELQKTQGGCGLGPLHQAAIEGNEEAVIRLLSNGAQANSKDEKGQTPLMHASWEGHLGVVQKLLQATGELGLCDRDQKGLTVLHHAADGGHEEVVNFLMSKGAQASSKERRGFTPLMYASWEGHLGVVQQLLQVVGCRGLAEEDEEGATALHHAADGGHEEVVAVLLSHGAQANSKDRRGVTPLMNASAGGHLAVVQRLSKVVGEQGLADEDEEGRTALSFAAEGGHDEVVDFLARNGAQANSMDIEGMTPLMYASCEGHLGVTQQLLQLVGEQGLTDRDENGRTALHYASEWGHEVVVHFFTSNGAEANSKDGKGMMPLMSASARGHLGVVQRLLYVTGDRGLVDRDQDGWMVLHFAASYGHEDVVNVLMSKGAQANSKDRKGRTPLMYASWRGHLGVVQKLLDATGYRGVVDKDQNGWTALHFSADKGHAALVTALLLNGAQANIKDGNGVTPFMYAARKGRLGAAQRLLQVVGGQGLREQDADGWTALHHAAEGGHEEVVDFLASNGAEANSKDDRGVTPLMQASWRGHLGVVERLSKVVGAQGLTERDEDDWTAIHFAADGGHDEVVACLLSQGAQADGKDGKGITPLMQTAGNGHLGVVQRLLQVVGTGGQGLKDQDTDGWTALHHAATGGHTDVVDVLLSHGAEANSKDRQGMTPLMQASVGGHLGVVQRLSKVVGEQGLTGSNRMGLTALHYAAARGNDEIVVVLLSHSSEADSKDRQGMTPLMQASLGGHLGVARALLLAEADTTITDNRGLTPRRAVERHGPAELVDLFKWWEAELERPYLLHRAKCISDVYMKHPEALALLNTAPVPAYLKARASNLPRVEVVPVQHEQGGTVGRKASAEARGTQEGEEERHAMLTYVMKELNEQLYIELLEGFHAPIDDDDDEIDDLEWEVEEYDNDADGIV